MLYYILSGFIILAMLALSCYFYVDYSFNKLDHEIEIPLRKDKPRINSYHRKYILPKASVTTTDSITKESMMFYELMMNLDWENIPVPNIEGNEVAKQTMKCFYNRVIESSGIFNSKIYLNNQDDVTTFDMLFTELNQNKGDVITYRLCREHRSFIGYEYTIDSTVKIGFFSTLDELREEYIVAQKVVAEQKIESEFTKHKACSICLQKETLVCPPDLFCTSLFRSEDSDFRELLTSFSISAASNRHYKLVGVCVWSQNQFVFSAVLINDDYYCRNIGTENLLEEYVKTNLNQSLRHIMAQQTGDTEVHLIYARTIFQ